MKTNSQLSAVGQRRRKEILELALAESQRLRRLRVGTRIAGGCAVVCLAIAAGMYVDSPGRSAPDSRFADQKRVGQPVTPRPTPVEQKGDDPTEDIDSADYIVRSSIGNLEDYLVPSRDELPQKYLLDDQQLISALTDLGKANSLVRSQGRVWLMKDGRPVAEHDLAVD